MWSVVLVRVDIFVLCEKFYFCFIYFETRQTFFTQLLRKRSTSYEDALLLTSADGLFPTPPVLSTEQTASAGMSTPIVMKQNAFQIGPKFYVMNKCIHFMILFIV